MYGVGTSGGRLDPACLFFVSILVSYTTLAIDFAWAARAAVLYSKEERWCVTKALRTSLTETRFRPSIARRAATKLGKLSALPDGDAAREQKRRSAAQNVRARKRTHRCAQIMAHHSRA